VFLLAMRQKLFFFLYWGTNCVSSFLHSNRMQDPHPLAQLKTEGRDAKEWPPSHAESLDCVELYLHEEANHLILQIFLC
jgi:hypothetical protein